MRVLVDFEKQTAKKWKLDYGYQYYIGDKISFY